MSALKSDACVCVSGRQVRLAVGEISVEQQRRRRRQRRQRDALVVGKSQRFLKVGVAAFAWLALAGDDLLPVCTQ